MLTPQGTLALVSRVPPRPPPRQVALSSQLLGPKVRAALSPVHGAEGIGRWLGGGGWEPGLIPISVSVVHPVFAQHRPTN